MNWDEDEGKEALKQLLQNFTYRPGWTFDVISVNDKDDQLIVNATVVDTDNHRRLIPITFGIGIPSFVRDNFPWSQWLLDQIIVVETHEAREFFKIDGVKVFDPHG